MDMGCDTGRPLKVTTEERRVERLEGNVWKPIPFSKIRKGDTFRLFDLGKNLVEVGKLYKAAGNAFLGSGGFYIVYIEFE